MPPKIDATVLLNMEFKPDPAIWRNLSQRAITITNDTEHAAALRDVERLWDATPGTPAFERLQILAEVVDAYEKVHHPIPEPSPEEQRCACGHTPDETPGCGGPQCLTELRKDLNAALQAKDRHEHASYAVLVLPRVPAILAALESMTWRAEAGEGSLAMARGERNLLRKDVARLTQELEEAKVQIGILEDAEYATRVCTEDYLRDAQNGRDEAYLVKTQLQEEIRILREQRAYYEEQTVNLTVERDEAQEDAANSREIQDAARVKALKDAEEIANLTHELMIAKGEAHLWSGKACEEEQAAGNGPCGACRYCLPRQYDDLDIANLRVQKYEKLLAQIGASCGVEAGKYPIEKLPMFVVQALDDGHNAADKAEQECKALQERVKVLEGTSPWKKWINQ